MSSLRPSKTANIRSRARPLVSTAVTLLTIFLCACSSDDQLPTDGAVDASVNGEVEYEFPEAVDGYTTLTFTRRVGFDGVICLDGLGWFGETVLEEGTIRGDVLRIEEGSSRDVSNVEPREHDLSDVELDEVRDRILDIPPGNRRNPNGNSEHCVYEELDIDGHAVPRNFDGEENPAFEPAFDRLVQLLDDMAE